VKKSSQLFIADERAQGAVEYIIIAAIMALFALAAVKGVSKAYGFKFTKTAALRVLPIP